MAHNPPPELPDEQWEALLRQLRSMPEAVPRPFIYARLQAPPAPAEALAALLPLWLRRPAYAVALGAVLLLLNAGVALYLGAGPRPPRATPAPDDAYAAFVAEYHLDPFSPAHE